MHSEITSLPSLYLPISAPGCTVGLLTRQFPKIPPKVQLVELIEAILQQSSLQTAWIMASK